MRGQVPLCKQEVANFVHGGQTKGLLLTAQLSQAGRKLAERSAGASEALIDIRFAGEQPLRDLVDTETAECLQCQHQLRLGRFRAAKFQIEPALDFVLLGTAFQFIQFALVGTAIGWIHGGSESIEP